MRLLQISSNTSPKNSSQKPRRQASQTLLCLLFALPAVGLAAANTTANATVNPTPGATVNATAKATANAASKPPAVAPAATPVTAPVAAPAAAPITTPVAAQKTVFDEADDSAEAARERFRSQTRDPFEVSARLRENRPSMTRRSAGGRDNGTLRLKAIVRGPGGAMAQIEAGQETMIVQEGDTLDLNGVRYIVTVEADGLTLRGAETPSDIIRIR